MRSFLFLFAILLAVPALAQQQMYRWVDDDGVQHYSDRPQEGAERIEVKAAQTFSAPVVPTAAAAGASDPEPSFSYERLDILKPGEEETIWNTANQVDVALALSPRLRRGDKIRWYIDGQLQRDVSLRATTVTLSDVWRGTHQLVAEVQDINGKSLIRSDQVTFEYKQTTPITSPLNPNNPNNPNNPGGFGGGAP